MLLRERMCTETAARFASSEERRAAPHVPLEKRVAALLGSGSEVNA